eukprot:3931968-Rhodomonas_salina.1
MNKLSVPGQGTLNDNGYSLVVSLIKATTTAQQRTALFISRQPSVMSTFAMLSGSAPQVFPVKKTSDTGSASWRSRRFVRATKPARH